VTFKPDVYGYDLPVLRALNQPLDPSVLALPRVGFSDAATWQNEAPKPAR
jgi:hypothetical protein